MWEEEVHIYNTPRIPNNFFMYKAEIASAGIVLGVKSHLYLFF